MDGGSILEIERRRSAFELIGATLALYRRYPWLFLVLAAVVVIPYQALDAIPTLGIVHGAAKGWLDFAVSVGDLALVVPLVSALHVYAVDDVRQGRQPLVASVGRRGIATLSIVSPAVFLSWLGITAGLVALIVPGVMLLIRWAVVAQTASLGASDWREALNRSKSLTDGRYKHVIALLLMVFLITELPSAALLPIFGLKTTALGPFVIRSALSVLTSSFTALATALLYFDLKVRLQTEGSGKPVLPPSLDPRPKVAEPTVPPTGHPLDPDSWSDEDRPAGWYVDPVEPIRMRYWPAGHRPQWSKRRARTPNATWDEWTAYHQQAKAEERPEGPV